MAKAKSVKSGKNKEDDLEHYWSAPWGIFYNEIVPLQAQGKIKDLQYRWERSTGCYVVRFRETEKFDVSDLFNAHEHFYDEYEGRRKWLTW